MVYEPDVAATNTKYDECHWIDRERAYAPVNGKWYYLEYHHEEGSQSEYWLMETKHPEQPGTQKKRVNARWSVWEKPYSFWIEFYSGLSVFNNKLVYNTQDTIYSYDPVTEKKQAIYTLTAAQKQTGRIFGSTVNGSVLKYILAQEPGQSDAVYCSIQLDPYTTVAAGGYACYVKNGTLYLKRSGAQKGSVLAAWYDVNGKMLGMRLLNQQELTIPVPGAKTVKVFAVAETSYKPLCEATVLLAS